MIVIVLLILVVTFPDLLPQEHVKCLEDNVLKWTSAPNHFFANNAIVKKTLMIILGVLVDITVLVQFYLWTIYGKSWRYAIAISCLYGLRLFLTVSYFNLSIL